MEYHILCKELENKLGIELRTPKDFRLLSERIEKEINERISIDTLMRIWGYKGKVNARRSTLDILAQYLGYEDYVYFLKVFPEEIGGNTQKRSPVKPKQHRVWGKRNSRWLVAAVSFLIIIGIALCYMYFQSNVLGT